MSDFVITESYEKVLNSKTPYAILYGGRVGGKSKGSAMISLIALLQNEGTDIVIARASYGSMKDSSYAEYEEMIYENDKLNELFEFKRSPLRIVRKSPKRETMYFVGYGGSNTSRTKSFKTKNRIGTIIFEETQELKNKESFDQAIGSYRRLFGKNVKVLILGNPPAPETHWFNIMVKKCKQDPDYYVKNMSYLDILPFVNDFDLKEIIKAKLLDNDFYRWFYMGETIGGYGAVYPMFRLKRHQISELDLRLLLENSPLKIVACLIGGDGAITKDCTAFVPLLLLNNGQSVAVDIFYHNPKTSGTIGYHQLVANNLSKWLNNICEKYHLGSIREFRKRPYSQYVPIIMRIDSAAPDLIKACDYFFSDRVDIRPVKKRTIMEMTSVMQSTIANDNITVCDNGKLYDYVLQKERKTDYNILVEQITSLIWNEKQTEYEKSIPNDVCDALTYIVFTWYADVENQQWQNIVSQTNANYEFKTIQDYLTEIKGEKK